VREIVLDTETTGLDPHAGHRIIEIGCVELYNHVPTGRTYHVYIDPQRDVPEEAYQVHGLDRDFLSRYPTFDRRADDFLAFIGSDPLVIHNAQFDMAFVNAELGWHRRPILAMDRAIDTVDMARRRFPGAQVNLDALCKRFEIDNSGRELHGALLDCQLLAEVYLELRGGREPGLALAATATNNQPTVAPQAREYREPRPHAPSEAERAAHAAMLDKLKSPIWRE
jgi:DNA polymerase-3 subunit epsilon